MELSNDKVMILNKIKSEIFESIKTRGINIDPKNIKIDLENASVAVIEIKIDPK